MAYTTINKHTNYFDNVLWSSQDTSIDTLNFAPDWAWIKSRSNADTHVLFDKVRGANKRLMSSQTSAESTTSDELTAFNSDGYTLGTGDNVNRSGHNYVSWNWLAGGTGSSNGNGSITSTVSANTTAGFSIVSYTGTGSNATVGHGLGVAPSMIIVKSRSSTDWWICYHKTQGATKYLALNFTNAVATNSGIWNDTEPTSSVFSIGTNGGTNGNGNNYIAYCFAEKPGYSKFGSYVGNGNADGAFVYTGFKPAFILLKDSTGSGNNWFIWDNKRDGYNVNNKYLRPNLDNAEGYYEAIDILSNGFKNRNTSSSANGSQTYIYMAFGQSLVGSNNVPCTAR